MSTVKNFPSVNEGLSEIIDNSNSLVKGAFIGLFSILELMPSYIIVLTTVYKELSYESDGYVISIVDSPEIAEQPYEEICKKAIIQFFIAVDEYGKAVKFIPIKK